MLNQVVLVGRLAQDIEITTTDDEKKIANITIAVPRNTKNEDGEYETDFINARLWSGIATNVEEYCKKGDLIGIKGRLESTDDKQLIMVAEKVTFLSNAKKEN